MDITTEALAYWYFRLNGFLTTVNFLVHPETTRDSRTDVDILGVRFPYRAENLRRPMKDHHDRLAWPADKAYVILSEVKTGQCALNGPWTKQSSHNMDKVLHAVGAIPPNQVAEAASQLYKNGTFSSSACEVSLVCVGGYRDEGLRERYPKVPQVTWDEIRRFIYERFRAYRHEKAQHAQWDKDGQKLWTTAMDSASADAFRTQVQVVPRR